MYGALPIEGAIQFRAILPPAHVAARTIEAVDDGALAVAAFIVQTMRPLQTALDAALARNDRPAALTLVYRALVPVAGALAAYTGTTLTPGQSRVHALLVELELLPCAAWGDGTLSEQGTLLTLHYRSWRLEPAEADRWADHLGRQFQTLWPEARFVVTEN